MSEVSILPADESHKLTIANLLQYYLYDFSEFEPSEMNDDGSFDYPYLDFYWRDPGRSAYLIYHREELAGFALVHQEKDPNNGEEFLDLTEFFIVRSLRRQKLGMDAAIKLWNQLPGLWHIRVLSSNKVAQAFWKHVISSYRDERYELSITDGEFCFQFMSG